MPVDARQHPRHSIDARADILGQEIVLAKEARDISVGGCQFEGTAWEAIGSTVDLVISFPSLDTHLALRGEVIHRASARWGIRFRLSNEDQRWALRKCIRQSLESRDPSQNAVVHP